MWKSLLPGSYDSQEEVLNSTWRRRRLGDHYSSLQAIHIFQIFSWIPSCGSDSWRNNDWTSSWSSNREKSGRIWDRICDSISCQTIHILRCDIQRNRVLWMKFMTTKKSSGPVTNCAKLVLPKGNKETRANPLSNPIIDSLFKKTVIPTGERKWIAVGGQPFTKKRFAYTGIQGDHEDDTSSLIKTDHIIGRPWNRYCWRCLHRREQNNQPTLVGFSWFSKAAVRQESNTSWTTRRPYVIYELFRDTLVVFQEDQKWWNTRVPHNWKEYIFHRRRKENDRARQAVFFTLLNPFGLPHLLETQSRCSKDQGLQFWQTKSSAIITYATQCQETALIVWFLRTEIK